MAIEFEFTQDHRKYREYITYVTKVDEAIGLLPFTFYQGDMNGCYVIERKDDIVTVTLSSNTKALKEHFIENAQPETFESIPDEVAYLYDIDKHELIYNFDAKEPSSSWGWSTYPETFWANDDDAYDHGLVMTKDSKLCRVYLSNKRLMSLFVGLQEVELTFPDYFIEGKDKVTLQSQGVAAVMHIIAAQLGQDEPKMNDIKKAISCGMVVPGEFEYPKYDFKDVVDLFELKGNDDDLWENTWGAGVAEAIARDELYPEGTGTSATLGELTEYGHQVCLSDLSNLGEVPESDRPVYVHMDIPIHGVHYMMIEPDRTLAIFFDDLIISEAAIYMHLGNLPEDQIAMKGDYVNVEDVPDSLEDRFDELAKLEVPGIIKLGDDVLESPTEGDEDTQDEDVPDYTDHELGLSGGRH